MAGTMEMTAGTMLYDLLTNKQGLISNESSSTTSDIIHGGRI